MENGLTFGVKCICVLGETSLCLEANASAFGVKCTCVFWCMVFVGDLSGCLLGVFSSWMSLMDCFGLSF